jgi:hypothetical protein
VCVCDHARPHCITSRKAISVKSAVWVFATAHKLSLGMLSWCTSSSSNVDKPDDTHKHNHTHTHTSTHTHTLTICKVVALPALNVITRHSFHSAFKVVLQWFYIGVTAVLNVRDTYHFPDCCPSGLKCIKPTLTCTAGTTRYLRVCECHKDATVVMQWRHSSVTVMLLLFYSGFTVVLQWCHGGVTATRYLRVTVVLQWCYNYFTVVLHWCYSGV